MKFKRKILALVLAVGLVLVICAACAYAADSSQAKGQARDMKTAGEVRTIVQEAYPDYTIGEIELEKGPVYDVEVVDKDGVPYDVEVDPLSGEILKIQTDDDYLATGKIVEDDDDGDDGEDD